MSALLRFGGPTSPTSLAVHTSRILSSSRFLSTTPTRMSVTEQSIREMFKPLEEVSLNEHRQLEILVRGFDSCYMTGTRTRVLRQVSGPPRRLDRHGLSKPIGRPLHVRSRLRNCHLFSSQQSPQRPISSMWFHLKP
jgi:hypothetical protein